jgi:drug/metabolite transporter (DMT)-like permease
MSNLWIWASVGAAFFQALRYAAMKVLNQHLSTGVTSYVRILFTVPFLSGYLLAVLHWTGQPLPAFGGLFLGYSAAAAIAQFVGTVLVVRMFQLGNFAIATLIIKADVIMTALIGTAFFSERITPMGWLAILVTIAGVVVTSLGRQPSAVKGLGAGLASLFTQSKSTLIGLAAALGYALSYLFLREAILVLDPAVPPVLRAALAGLGMAGTSSILLGIFLLVTQPRELARMLKFPKACWLIGFLSSFGTIGWFLASALANASYVAAAAQVQVAFTLLLSYFYFGERIRRAEIAGIVIMVAGLILFRTA